MRLSEQLRRGRIDRPDEWTMDRYIEKATELEDTIRELVAVSEDMSNGTDVGNRLIAAWDVADVILEDNAGSSDEPKWVTAEWILENLWRFQNETWWEATLAGEHRQFVRVRWDIDKQEYVLDVVGQGRESSEEFWRYKNSEWRFLPHSDQIHLNTAP